MADKIDVKLILELRQANMSQRAIAASRHISTKSVAAVWKRADALVDVLNQSFQRCPVHLLDGLVKIAVEGDGVSIFGHIRFCGRQGCGGICGNLI